ncbi:MAG: hypothetical protein WC242_00610 [Candidatus Paceibacterota bacterium]|jgi:bifunctional DNA-binding transcriptional regulator/antitoxin component of YhaV-PrlF toxin-antitoxin module
MTTIAKATIRGQITLPVHWRRNFSTNRFILKEQGDKLEITPLRMEDLGKKDEYTVFDAIRDNKGKGIKAKDLVKVLKTTL